MLRLALPSTFIDLSCSEQFHINSSRTLRAPIKQLGLLLASVSLFTLGCAPAASKPSQATAKPAAGKLAERIDPEATDTTSSTNKAAATNHAAPADIPVDPNGYVVLEKPTSNESAAVDTGTAEVIATAGDNAGAEPIESVKLGANTATKAERSVDSETPAELSLTAAQTASAIDIDSSKASAESSEQKVDGAMPDRNDKLHSAESGLATFDEKHQQIAPDWPRPQALLFFTGQQHGYIEPCGCTGLENQKGGLNRRDTLLTQLKGRGWDVIPMDVGNFERRLGRQAEIKFQTTVEALKDMQYRCATLGVDDLKLSSTHLLALTATEGKTETPFISANAYVLIEEYMPKSKIIEVGGRKIGVTAILGDSFQSELASSSDVIITGAAESLKPVVAQLKKAGCDYMVLLAHATLQESQELAKEVPGFDLVVTAGGFPEPQYQLEEVEGSKTKMAQVGAKGMYSVMVGLYPDSDTPVRYQRIALSSQFADSPRMLTRFANYQKQLESLGLDGLGVRSQALDDNLRFVGSEKCGDCHSQAFAVWKDSAHFGATESLVHPPNDRSAIPRHFDPECLSCHVTGWNPQNYYPYASGFASLEKTPLLTGNGCENCHGPGSAHVAAESGDIDADDELLKKLREKMRLPLAEARDQCQRCHDQDNSPEFQHEGAFEEYWKQIAHPGKY